MPRRKVIIALVILEWKNLAGSAQALFFEYCSRGWDGGISQTLTVL
jgi:hypothetical protein